MHKKAASCWLCSGQLLLCSAAAAAGLLSCQYSKLHKCYVFMPLLLFLHLRGGGERGERGVKNSLTQNKSQCWHSKVIKCPRQAAPGENFDTDNTRCVYVINVITSCHARRLPRCLWQEKRESEMAWLPGRRNLTAKCQ